MKNIHLIPTDKPSRLYKTGNFLLLDSKAMPNNTLETKNQNIYITSDEEIKEEDWVIYNNKISKIERGDNELFHLSKKIILTTDQDLIKDGVQAIDDDFLEWFVKNPSCEEVKIEEGVRYEDEWIDNEDGGEIFQHQYCCYKIIIPKQEQKQHLIDIMRGDEELGLYEEPKQETLEEAAEKILSKEGIKLHPSGLETYLKGNTINAMVEMAKWQQERMYNEEESIQKIIDYVDFQFNTNGELNTEIKKWFEQFKKKV